MAKQFPKALRKAWLQYQDLYDRHMRLLRKLGEGDLESIYKLYESHIEYAQHEWQSPEERFEEGQMDDDEPDSFLDGGEDKIE